MMIVAGTLGLVAAAVPLPGGDAAPQVPACLCATDDRRSFRAVLTAADNPAAAPAILENTNASSYSGFSESQQGAGWSYIGSKYPLSAYVYAWGWPLGFPAASKPVSGRLGECLTVNMDDGDDGTAMLRNYSLTVASGHSFRCGTDGRGSQSAASEVYMYACRCDSTMKPVFAPGGSTGRCFRVNGTDGCGTGACDTDTFHLAWNAQHTLPCLALRNGTEKWEE